MMGETVRIVHYLNQFFGQVGGEDKADVAAQVREGPVGPGRELERVLAHEGRIVATVVAGDNFMAQDLERNAAGVAALLRPLEFDVFIAGPAFSSGRYGMACGAVCAAVGSILRKPTVTAMHPENPGVEEYKSRTYILPCGSTAADMRNALSGMSRLALRLASGQKLSPETDGYIPQGRRVNVFAEKHGAARALDMLTTKIRGQQYQTELPMPTFDRVRPAPALKDLRQSTIVLITTGGIVPLGNPDRLPSANAGKWVVYDVEGVSDLTGEEYQSIHGGYDPTFANDDPDRVLPLDAAVKLEEGGVIGRLYRKFFCTVGNTTAVASAVRFGREMAAYMRDHAIDAAILTST